MDGGRVTPGLGIRTLLALEAHAHRWPHREVRAVAGGLLVHDPADSEPIFNRLVDPDVPDAEPAREAWLGEVVEAFARLARRPHLWLTLAGDDPRLAWLERRAFGRIGTSRYMYLDDPSAVRRAAAAWRPTASGLAVERVDHRTEHRQRAARDVAAVIADAFDLDAAYHVLIEADVIEMLEVTPISFVLVRLDGEPVAVARRTTDGGASLLAAIGTRRAYRGRGFGRLVTATATGDALAAGSETVFLGIEDGNDAARHLYEELGYAFATGGGVIALLRG